MFTAFAQGEDCNGCKGKKKKECKKDEPALACKGAKKKGEGCKKDEPALACKGAKKKGEGCKKDEAA
jgi:hypothetical protein